MSDRFTAAAVAVLLAGVGFLSGPTGPQPCRAGPSLTLAPPAPAATAGFAAGRLELEESNGIFFSPVHVKRRVPVLNVFEGDLRLGVMLTGARDAHWWSGNFEFLFDAFGEGVVAGPGTSLAGGRLLFRRNFVRPDSRWVPYLQGGLGLLDNDVWHNRRQRVIGEGLEFSIKADAGLRYQLDRHWSLHLEATYQHISNGGLASPNIGVNAFGGGAGVGYSF